MEVSNLFNDLSDVDYSASEFACVHVQFLLLGLASSLEMATTPIAKELDHFIFIITIIATSFGLSFAIIGVVLKFTFLET